MIYGLRNLCQNSMHTKLLCWYPRTPFYQKNPRKRSTHTIEDDWVMKGGILAWGLGDHGHIYTRIQWKIKTFTHAGKRYSTSAWGEKLWMDILTPRGVPHGPKNVWFNSKIIFILINVTILWEKMWENKRHQLHRDFQLPVLSICSPPALSL